VGRSPEGFARRASVNDGMTFRRAGALVPGALVSVALIALAACGNESGTSGAAGGKHPLRLAMVTDTGGLGDKSFNDSAYAGLQRAHAALGADIEVLQSKSAADYQPNLTVLADEDYDEIFAVGFLMNKDLTEVARDYASNHFAIVDAVSPEKNVTSAIFREQDGSFLAGALAALVSKTRTIGFLGGIDVPLLRKFEAGFAAGARQIDPRVNVTVKYVGSFEDVSSGKELAGVMYDGGADIIYIAAGKSGIGALEETRARPQAYAIGVDSDEDGLIPGKILTSMVKHVDVAVYTISADAQAHKLPAGPIEFGLKNDGVGLTDFKYTKGLIGSANLARVERLRRAIIAGKIVPPQTREELAAFKPVKL
jgi:basic membrane protein A